MEKVVLSVDCGTQSIRALIFDQKGNLLYKYKKAFPPYESEEPGRFEADPKMFYDAMVEVCQGIRAMDEDVYASVEAISVTTQRDTSIIVDEEGEPIRKAIIWMDNRKAEGFKSVNPFYRTIFTVVKMRNIIDTIRETSHMHWLQQNEPENWEKTHKFLLLSSYLNFRLTGEYKDSDASLVGHIPFNYKTRKWDSRFGVKSQIFSIKRNMLPEPVPSCTVMGTLTEAAANDLSLPKGLKVIAAGSDKGCETVGVGCLDNSYGSISLGSQATIQTTTEKYYELDPFFPPFASVKPNAFNPEISLYRGFWLVKWFEEEFANEEMLEAERTGRDPLDILNDHLDKIPVGCDGLILQPYWGEELTRPGAKGCILGFGDKHTRIHLYRAIIEGVGYAMLDGILKIERVSGHKLENIALSGGGSQSDAICQIAADIFGRKVYRVQTYETSGLGAAIAAFTALGVHPDFDSAVKAMVRPTSFFKPDSINRRKYMLIYENVYKNMYKKLKPVYKLITKTLHDVDLITRENIEKAVKKNEETFADKVSDAFVDQIIVDAGKIVKEKEQEEENIEEE